MVDLKFPGRDAPIPQFVRQLFDRRDVESKRLDMEQVRLMLELGLPMAVDEVYERLEFTKPDSVVEDTVDGTVPGQEQAEAPEAGQDQGVEGQE
jgi:hypothetical protein